MNNSFLSGLLSGTGNIFTAIDGFFTDNSIDVMYKAIATVGALFMFYAIPPLRKFTVWAAFALLFILMLQSQPNSDAQSPATSSLPLPTQVNTPVPPTASGSSTQTASSGSSSGGFLSFLGDAISIAGLFA